MHRRIGVYDKTIFLFWKISSRPCFRRVNFRISQEFCFFNAAGKTAKKNDAKNGIPATSNYPLFVRNFGNNRPPRHFSSYSKGQSQSAKPLLSAYPLQRPSFHGRIDSSLNLTKYFTVSFSRFFH